ncbi:hypothetical protein FQN57_004891 [Myotisia sp. PD_48]|nr:hypothetical protein FQN57_004891 [Myotisia sp. PD_48]
MTNFDPKLLLQDPTAWSATGIKQKNGQFISTIPCLVHFNTLVYVHNALPVTRAEYCSRHDIQEGDISSTEIWSLVDKVLVINKKIKSDIAIFHDKTWPDTVAPVNDLFNYAETVGGDKESSYYAVLLTATKEYIAELNKPLPDKKKLQEGRELVAGVVEELVPIIDKLLSDSKKSRSNLQSFQQLCADNRSSLAKSGTELRSQIDKEHKEIAALRTEASKATSQIQLIQEEFVTAASSEGSKFGVIGALLGRSISTVLDLFNSVDKKLRGVMILDTNVGKMTNITDELLNAIPEAIGKFDRLEQTWKKISDDIQGLRDVINKGSKLPPFLLTDTQIQAIREEWNKLRDYDDKYRGQLFNTGEVKDEDIKDLLKALQQPSRG